MKKITESQLKDRVSGLRQYMAAIEGNTQVNEEGVMNALGQLGGAVAGTVGNGVKNVANAAGQAVGGVANAAGQVVGGVQNAANAVGSAVGGAYDAAKQGVQKVAGDVAAGYKQGVASANGQTQSAKPAVVPGKPDPAVMKIQQDLIAKGAKIKADGVMGPATKAAQAQFAAAPAAAPQRTPAEVAASADLLSANNAGNINAGLDPADPRWKGPKPAGTPAPSGAAAAMAAPAAAPAPAPSSGVEAAKVGIAAGSPALQPAAAPNGAAAAMASKSATPAQPVTMENVGYDEVQRLVSLVQYR